ncbi:protein kinase [Nonomuraea sp. NPDC050556]|uniref:serine/threonine-protein kinase n=1 Tax=Nonomuraea sp. NPDC050556 TaxID=3364369 RepID=UPI0037B6BE44
MERQVSNRYRLMEPLGEGGMGVVWRAYDELLDRTVAIKEVRYTGIGEDKRAELNRRTIREARAAGRLDHPSVVVIHDVIEEDGRPWIVMQLVRSRSLAEVIREHGALPVEQVARIGASLLGALRAAHATGVLHRDVKPENVLLADDGRVVLTDFGIASMEAEVGLTATGGLVGTPAYMPPERLNGLPAQPESDLWSLGATLYAAVEGKAPFKRDSWAATVAAVLRDRPEPPRLAGPLGPVISGLLRHDPAERLSADEAAAQLQAVSVGRTATVEHTQDIPAPRKRRRWVIPAAAAGVVAAVSGGAFFLVNAPGGGTVTQPTPTASSPTPTVTKTASSLPKGWRTLKNSDGDFSIAVPDGWTAQKHPTRDSVTYTTPDGPGSLVVEWTVPENPVDDPAQAWRNLEAEIQRKGEFTGYTRLGITPLTYLGVPAADWEFTRVRAGELIHVVNRGFTTRSGRPFALYWETRADRWNAARRYFTTFAKTFRPL